MNAQPRQKLLFGLLAGALAWSGWLALNEPAEDTGLVEVVEPRATPARSEAADGMAGLPTVTLPEARVRLAHARSNLFPEQTWYVPPPPPPPPPYIPPPPPQAPPLPFAYMGRWLEAGETTWYLSRGGTPIAVRAGQVVDGVWRLDPPRGGSLHFTYLPLNQTRSLRTGD